MYLELQLYFERLKMAKLEDFRPERKPVTLSRK